MKKKYLSTIEVAKILGISREAVFKKIKKGQLPAVKIGRNYAIDPTDIGLKEGRLDEKRKREIEKAVKRTFKQYGEALKKLGDA